MNNQFPFRIGMAHGWLESTVIGLRSNFDILCTAIPLQIDSEQKNSKVSMD